MSGRDAGWWMLLGMLFARRRRMGGLFGRIPLGEDGLPGVGFLGLV
jgi:hypothetical protein